jgi:hypothetical protein
MNGLETTALLIMLLMVGSIIGIYSLLVRNDLSRRWERLVSLAANVRAARQRRQGVGRDVCRHLGKAQRHEQHVMRSGAKRGAGGGRIIKVSDNSNGWPTAQTTSFTADAMQTDRESRDAEMAARKELHAEAEGYNAIVRSWPSCIVAKSCGFRPWRYKQHHPARRGKR